MSGAEADGGRLSAGEEPVPTLRPPVASLAGLAADHVDAAVRPAVRYVLLRKGPPGREAEIVAEHVHHRAGAEQVHLPALFLPVLLLGLEEYGLVLLQPSPGGDLEASVLQALQNGDGPALVDLAGPGAALDGPGRARAVEGDFLGGEGQRAVISQQHHALTGSLIGDLQVFLLPPGHFAGAARLGQQFHCGFLLVPLPGLFPILACSGRGVNTVDGRGAIFAPGWAAWRKVGIAFPVKTVYNKQTRANRPNPNCKGLS